MAQQFVNIRGEEHPVERLCGWGVWKGDTEFDHEATRDVVRESFSLWGGPDDPARILPSLHIVGAGPYTAGQRSMLWEVGRKLLKTDPLNYPQEVGDCFVDGTLVTMADGTRKPIEDVRAGDVVATPFGNARRVVRTIRKRHHGNLHSISADGHPSRVVATADHRFVHVPREDGRPSGRMWRWQDVLTIWPDAHVLVPGGVDKPPEDWDPHRVVARVASHEVYDGRGVDVRCLGVEYDHSFIANGYAVHNCVSFGGKNAIEYVQFFPMANGEMIEWTEVFPPYLWGCGRIFVGNNQLGRQDGSIGAWQAKAVMEYGAIAKHATLPDGTAVPAYSGQVAREWGNMPGPDQKWVALGKQHIVKSAAPVNTWEDLVQALVNGYPVTAASNVGFDMKARSDGFMHYSTHWGHQLCFIGVDDDPSDPYVCILNSWGDAFGEIKDFKTGETWPKGTIRARKKDALAMLAEQDAFAYSAFNGFPAQTIDRDRFDLW
jgi:hypothetical protein